MEKLLMDFFNYLIANADKITAAVAMIIVIVILRQLVNDIGKRTEEQFKRDDERQIKILDLYGKITDSIDRQVTISERHETAAKERATEQEKRDTERITLHQHQIKVLQDMVAYLPVMSETKATVDTIENTVLRIPGNVADMRTDLTALIDRRHAETLSKIEQSFQLIENALKTLQARLDDAVTVQDAHVESEGTRHSAMVVEIRAIADVLKIISNVLENTHSLVQALQPVQGLPQAGEPTTNEPPLSSAA